MGRRKGDEDLIARNYMVTIEDDDFLQEESEREAERRGAHVSKSHYLRILIRKDQYEKS